VQGTASLAEIALICSFSSQASFTRAFTRGGIAARQTPRCTGNDRTKQMTIARGLWQALKLPTTARSVKTSAQPACVDTVLDTQND
jgi:hypothetical protein